MSLMMDLFIDNVIFQKPTDDSSKYEEERWEVRFEVGFSPDILETLDSSSTQKIWHKIRK